MVFCCGKMFHNGTSMKCNPYTIGYLEIFICVLPIWFSKDNNRQKKREKEMGGGRKERRNGRKKG